jgi:hypothetical protein
MISKFSGERPFLVKSFNLDRSVLRISKLHSKENVCKDDLVFTKISFKNQLEFIHFYFLFARALEDLKKWYFEKQLNLAKIQNFEIQ